MTLRSACFLLVLVATSLLTSPAAAKQTVVLVLAGGSAAELFPYELRVRSELLSAGYSVTTVQVPEAGDTGHLARTAGGMMTQAAVAIVLSQDSISGAVWATSHDSQRTLLRTIQPEPLGEDAAATFAIRATEVLNAVLIELGYPRRPPVDLPKPPGSNEPPQEVSPTKPPPSAESAESSGPPPSAAAPALPARPPSSPPVSKPSPTPAPKAQSPWGAGAGVALLAGPGGVPPALAPALSLRHAPAPPWWAELALIAPALGTLRDDVGRARVDQEIAVLKAGASYPLGAWARGFVALGGGAYRLGVRGSATPPYSGRRDHVLSAAGVLGLGARTRLGDDWWLQLDATAMLTTPRAEVVFSDHTQARSGRPLLTAGVSLWLDP